jgi:FkbM family methyltransferase
VVSQLCNDLGAETDPCQDEQLDFSIIRRHGLLYLVDHISAVDRELEIGGAWEEEQIQYLFAFARKEFDDQPAAFLDFGSYFGIYSLRASQYDYIKEQHAVDGDPKNYMQLCANIFLNGLEHRIRTHNVALSASSGFVNYRISSTNPQNRGGTGVILETEVARAAPCVAADDIVAIRGRNIICKLDVEGHEISVMEGMKALLSMNNVVLQIEMWEDWPESYKATMDVVVGLGFVQRHKIGPDHYFTRRSSHWPAVVSDDKPLS